ncbi:predicted protein [Naegleria gruberi]|uniref:Predicted protein n=1 Tax=Naegleria gruberi TaxID=5762 RepID=D2VA71_NAEGR|nr:uncharacterized protein NAEGRDRAFT_65758 [Naegleria gruberi]EFC46378.1 predicted protein [Naegleria gruberi]|eukprot:XP_002679122.1 predicted protein [Naegleria gruberi strain NEG-M]
MRKVRSVLPTRENDSIEEEFISTIKRTPSSNGIDSLISSVVGASNSSGNSINGASSSNKRSSHFRTSSRDSNFLHSSSPFTTPLSIPPFSSSSSMGAMVDQSPSLGSYSPSPLLAQSSSKSFIDFEIEQLRSEIEELKVIVESMMDESHSYAIKYTRRILIVSNTLISIYAVGRRLYELAYSNKGTILNPFTYISIFKNNKPSGLTGSANSSSKLLNNIETLNKYGLTSKNRTSRILLNQLKHIKTGQTRSLSSMLDNVASPSGKISELLQNIRNSRQIYSNRYSNNNTNSSNRNASSRSSSKGRKGDFIWRILGLIWKEFLCAAVLTLSSYWLMKTNSMKKQIAVILSLVANLYLALTTDLSPWAIYFNFVSIFLYITAQYVKNTPESMETVKLIASNITKSLSMTKTDELEQVIDDTLKDTCTVSTDLVLEDTPRHFFSDHMTD